MNQYSITFEIATWLGDFFSVLPAHNTRMRKKCNVFEKSICIFREGKRFQCDYRYFVPCQLSTVKFRRGVKKGMRGLRLACFLKGTSAQRCFNLTFKKKMTYRTHCCTEEKRWNKKRKRVKLHGIHHIATRAKTKANQHLLYARCVECRTWIRSSTAFCL